MSLLCSCNLDAQVVYRGACIFHCLASPREPRRAALCGAARGIHRAECIRDVPVDVCIDEKIASVPISRSPTPPSRIFSLASSFSAFFCPPFIPLFFFQAVPFRSFLRRARNAMPVRVPFSLSLSFADNPVRRMLRRKWDVIEDFCIKNIAYYT